MSSPLGDSAERYAFGAFELDVGAFRLSRGGDRVPVQPKTLELLIRLVRAQGLLVPRDEIVAALWPDTVVTEQSLRQVVRRVREAVGEDLVETVPRVGFRFTGTVARLGDGPIVERALPVAPEPFVGRRDELGALHGALTGDTRLVSLVGPGGVGKTRLAVEYARERREHWPGGVWFADLVDARDAADVVRAVGAALDLPLGRDPVGQIGHAIAGRGRCLVILDNVEQLLSCAEALESTVARWTARTAAGRFLATTRSVLGVRGEEVLLLPPLAHDDAVALFVRRARAARVGFDDDPVAIDRLVALLDRLPLAIELAAARVRVLSPPELLHRLEDRFAVLASRGRGRHATLRAAFDWSWELLSPRERQVLAELSVFSGGFTLDAAEQVVGGPLLDVLQALVDQSLVRSLIGNRFDLLVTVQEYAREHLVDPDATEVRHGRWAAGLGADDALDAMDGPRDDEVCRALIPELSNLWTAAQRAIRRSDAEVAARTALAGWAAARSVAAPGSAGDLLEAVLGLPEVGPIGARVRLEAGRARKAEGRLDAARIHLERAMDELGGRLQAIAIGACGALLSATGRADEARALFQRAIGGFEAAGDPFGAATVSVDLSAMCWREGRTDEGRRHVDAALARFRRLGARRSEAVVLGVVANRIAQEGRLEEGERLLEQAIAASRACGAPLTEVVALGALAILNANRGDRAHARTLLTRALAIRRELGFRAHEGHVLELLSWVCAIDGDLDGARVHAEQALEIAREQGTRRNEGDALARIAGIDRDAGRVDDAIRGFRAAIAILREVNAVRYQSPILQALGELEQDADLMAEALAIARQVEDPRQQSAALRTLGRWHHQHGRRAEARAHLAESEALMRRLATPHELAYVLCLRAELDHEEGFAAAAAAAFAEATELAAQVHTAPESALGQILAATRARVTV